MAWCSVEAQDFIESKEDSFRDFQDPQWIWICDFGFLVDITDRQLELNDTSSGQGPLVHIFDDIVKGLQSKLIYRRIKRKLLRTLTSLS